MAQMTMTLDKNSVQRLNKCFHIDHKETYEYLQESRWFIGAHITFARSCCIQSYFQRHSCKCCFWLNLNLHSVFIFLLILTLATKPRHTNYLTQQMLRSNCQQYTEAQITNTFTNMVWDSHILLICTNIFHSGITCSS